MTEAQRKRLWEKRHQILFRAEMSALYHQKRERFFELCDKLGKAVSVIGGSAAIWKVSSREFVELVAIVITMSSTLSLVFGFSDKSRRHADLARKYKAIIAEIALVGEYDFVESNINSWDQKVCLIEAEEPPTLNALAHVCQYEIARSAGKAHTIKKVNWHQKIFMHFFDLPALH